MDKAQSQVDGKALFEELLAEGLPPATIRQRLQAAGLSNSDIYTLLGMEQAKDKIQETSYSEAKKEYSGCLTVFMGLGFLGSCLLICLTSITLFNSLGASPLSTPVSYESLPAIAYFLLYSLSLVSLVSSWNLWKYKKVGYWGFLVLLPVVGILGFIIQNLLIGIVSLVVLLWFYFTMRQYQQYLR